MARAAPEHPDYRVQVSSQFNGNADGSNRPIYRSTEEEIVSYADRLSDLSEAGRAVWISKKLAELARLQQLNREFDERHGIAAAEAAIRSASEAEQDARLALIVLRPRNAAEAREKALYVASAGAFTENWSGDDVGFADRIIAALGEVMS